MRYFSMYSQLAERKQLNSRENHHLSYMLCGTCVLCALGVPCVCCVCAACALWCVLCVHCVYCVLCVCCVCAVCVLCGGRRREVRGARCEVEVRKKNKNPTLRMWGKIKHVKTRTTKLILSTTCRLEGLTPNG